MPYLPSERQYRNFAASNFQPVQREAESEEPSYIVEGHFTVFDAEYELVPGFFETVDRHALDETDMSDVLFQFDHTGMVLSRLRNHSLQIGIDSVGGWARADLSGCQQGRDLYEAISNGLIDRMSFGFTIADDGVEYEEDEDGNIHSRITKVSKLFDVSAVDLPASEHTDISARSYVDAVIESRNKVAEPEVSEQEPEPVEQRESQEEAVTAEGVEIEGTVESFDIDAIVEQVIERMSQLETHEDKPEEVESPETVTDASARRRRARALSLIEV